ncbi:MerR family transcriptional regulator [Pseudonocardia kujensis]|uniref:MerR family transcriptional regulator n=1 Tax=Pseudonocardia kujensis TaxID=1128675 RepID=UPI001E634530|nr:MerR family transcriptional regulator [Pseudonocardia kujensis]MCE0766467.1 MerR family transcriptional regulator [Pseudonocardia kujensis]
MTEVDGDVGGGACPGPAGVSIGTAADYVGVSVETLRAWQRRYGVGASAVTPGGHRRYTFDDLVRLRTVRDLVAAGESTATAVRAVQGTRQPQTAPEPDVSAARRLAGACMELDGHIARQLVGAVLAADGVIRTWESLVRPAFTTLERLPLPAARTVGAEHLLSHVVIGTLGARVGREPRDRPAVVLACAPAEQHELPMAVLAAALAERAVRATLLGGRTPAATLVAAAGMPGSGRIVLYAHLPIDDPEAAIRSLPDPAAVVAAGPAWDGVPLDPAVRVCNDLADCLAVVGSR